MTRIFRDFEHAMLVVRILAGIGLNVQCREKIMKIAVPGVMADRSNPIKPRRWRRVTHAPGRAASPEFWHALLLAGRWGNEQIKLYLVERVGVLFSARIRPLR